MTLAQIGAVESRTVWTAATFGAVALVTILVWRAGSWLRDRTGAETVEVIQAAVVTVAGTGAAVLLVALWGLGSDVRLAFLPALTGLTAVRAMVSVLVLAAVYTLTRITKRFVMHGYRRDALSRHQREVGHHFLQVFLAIAAVLFVLAFWGVHPSNLLIGAGAAGLILGLAARQTLSAALAGFVLLGSRPFAIGDWVVVDEVEGIVTDLSIFNTRIRTFDGEQVTLPNDEVTSTHVVNRSTTGQLRVSVDVGVAYDTDLETALTTAESAMDDVDVVLSGPPPDVVLDRLGDSAIVLELRFWIDDPSIERKWEAQNAVVEAVTEAFAEAGIEIPFPQRVLSTGEGALALAGDHPASETAAGGGVDEPNSAEAE